MNSVNEELIRVTYRYNKISRDRAISMLHAGADPSYKNGRALVNSIEYSDGDDYLLKHITPEQLSKLLSNETIAIELLLTSFGKSNTKAFEYILSNDIRKNKESNNSYKVLIENRLKTVYKDNEYVKLYIKYKAPGYEILEQEDANRKTLLMLPELTMHYQIKHKIGEGGNSQVFLITDSYSNKYACKIPYEGETYGRFNMGRI